MSFGADGSVAVRERRELFGGKGADQAVALNQLDREVALSVWSATTGRARTSSHDGIDVSGVVRRVGTRTSLLVDVVTNSGALQEGRLPRTPPPAPRRRWRTRCSTSAAVLTFITAVQPESTGVTAPGQSGAACRGGMGSVEAQRTALAAAAPFIGINPGTASRTAVAEEEVRSLGAQGRHRPVRLAIEAVD
jgi:hypothetical protein